MFDNGNRQAGIEPTIVQTYASVSTFAEYQSPSHSELTEATQRRWQWTRSTALITKHRTTRLAVAPAGPRRSLFLGGSALDARRSVTAAHPAALPPHQHDRFN